MKTRYAALILAFSFAAEAPAMPAAQGRGDSISPEAFAIPPMESRPGALWVWLNGTVDHARMTREMEEARALGMRGLEIWDIGALVDPNGLVPAGPAFLGSASLKSIRTQWSGACQPPDPMPHADPDAPRGFWRAA